VGLLGGNLQVRPPGAGGPPTPSVCPAEAEGTARPHMHPAQSGLQLPCEGQVLRGRGDQAARTQRLQHSGALGMLDTHTC
jgi:hypothetical protein